MTWRPQRMCGNMASGPVPYSCTEPMGHDSPCSAPSSVGGGGGLPGKVYFDGHGNLFPLGCEPHPAEHGKQARIVASCLLSGLDPAKHPARGWWLCKVHGTWHRYPAGNLLPIPAHSVPVDPE